MRNRYLDLQRKKMKELKTYLHKSKFSRQNYIPQENPEQPKSEEGIQKMEKLEFIPGVIVKVKLPEPCINLKKLKNEVKATSLHIKYVDIPSTGEEIFLRFDDKESAAEYCEKEFLDDSHVLEGDEEISYWDKLNNDRDAKFKKSNKKQRGKDKLLKRAEKRLAQHMRFEGTE